MRDNQPITERELPLRDDIIIVSRTDLRGVIQEVNGGFIEASGYTAAELIGQPHNILRHPSMPAAVFADFWATLKAGRPWTGTVKNRRKNGDHYWVVANVTPLCENGDVVGFLSLRRPASRQAIANAERAYADIRSGRLRDFEVRNGEVQPRQRLQAMNPLWKLSLSTRLLLFGAFGVGLSGLLLELALAGYGRGTLWLMLLLGLGFVAYSAHWLSRDVVGRLQDARRALRQIGDNRFDAAIDVSRADEVGDVLQGLKSMQIRLGYSVEESRLRAAELARVQSGLDFTDANLMMLDPTLHIIYANRAMKTTLQNRETRLRHALPAFSAAALPGSAFEALFAQPADTRQQLLALRSGRRERLAIAGISFDLSINPVTAANGGLLGFVVEWNDRTAELQIEHEVGEVVRAAAAGDFSGRIGSDGKQGFLLALAEGIDALLASTADSLSDLQVVLAALADGDLTRRITRDCTGVLAQMKQDTNRSIASLGTIIGQIRDSAQTIDQAAAEIASGNADLSMRSEQQAANLEETASSMEELTSTVRQNAESARQARELARGAADVATRGGVVVADVVSTMDAISAASRKIEDIIGVIDGIAFQTNILALNAAVEAARAGEQGRGFAVVAAEVRSLAGRSADAAKEIKALIGHSVQTVANGSNLVHQAGTTMRDIVSSVDRVNALMGEIAAATDEQAAGVDVVSQTIMQLDEATQQNAALVEQASAAATALEEQASELSGSISRFRLAADAPAGRANERTRPRAAAPPASPSTAPRAAPGRSPARREGAAATVTEAHHWDEF